MATPAKVMKIARWLSIETSGKTDEEIRKAIAEKVKQPSPPPQKKEGIESFARTIGRWVGEYEHMRREIMSGLTASPLQKTGEPSPAAEKPKPTAPRRDVETTPKVDRALSIKADGRPIGEAGKEIAEKKEAAKRDSDLCPKCEEAEKAES